MKQLMKNINRFKVMVGSEIKKPVKEVETKERIFQFRRSCYFKVDMNKGDIVTEDNLTTLRPNKGIDAREYFSLIGKILTVNKKAFEHLSYTDFKQ